MSDRISGPSKQHVLISVLLVYTTCCLVFAGAGRDGFFAHGILQAIAGIGIAILVFTWPRNLTLKPYTTPLSVMISIAVIGLIHVIPLPANIWPYIPGRTVLIEGFATLDLPLPSLPLSLDRESTLIAVGYTLTPIFVLLLCARIGLRRLIEIVPAFLSLLAVISVLMGGAQLLSGGDSFLYFYEFTSRGLPVGFFSNINHQATLLVMALPFSMHLLSDLESKSPNYDAVVALRIITATSLGLIVLGILGTGSIAGYTILALTVLLFFSISPRRRNNRKVIIAPIILLIFAVLAGAVLYNSPSAEHLGLELWRDSGFSRAEIWDITMLAIQDHWLFGTGLGTFESVIPLYEDPTKVTSVFVAKAHNDYLQIFMETGVVGIVLVVVAIGWFFRRSMRVLKSKTPWNVLGVQKAASVALVVLLLHSCVDYPARTPAILSVMAICVAILAGAAAQRSRPAVFSGPLAENDKRVTL